MPKIGPEGFSIPLEEWYQLGKAILADIIPIKKKLLNYDTSWLLSYYDKVSDGKNILKNSDGTIIAPYEISYDYRKNPLDNWGDYIYVGDFQLTNKLAVVKEYLIKLFSDKGLLYKGDNVCPRVKDITAKDNNLIIEIEKVHYFDQVATNLSLDYTLNEKIADTIGAKTLRKWDLEESKTKNGLLPSFINSKLANTIGVALAIIAKNKKGESVILIRQRTKNVAVNAKMNVLPFSFSLNMETKGLVIGKKNSIFDLIKSDFRHEQAEELGLEPSHLNFEKVTPLLLCRELCRGGKPEFFFEIEMDLTFEELQKLIKESVQKNKEFTDKLVGLTMSEVKKSLNLFSPEVRAYIATKT